MDVVDITERVAEIRHKANLETSYRAEAGVIATGQCHYCNAPITERGRRWCDAECRDAWELEND